MKPSERVNILIVDDQPDEASSIATTLGDLDQNIVQASSGREALRCLASQDFAMILLDAGMPDMDGFDTAARIRQRKRSEHTPIIFITAETDGEHLAKGYALGAVDFVQTPVDPDVLRTKVRVFVDLYQKTENIRQQAAHRVQLAREQAARQAAEKAMRRSALLAEASRLLSRSLDFDATLVSLHRALVPTLCDACQLVLDDPNGGYWFAPVPQQEVAGGTPRSHPRIEKVRPELSEAIRRAIESGHALAVPAATVANAPGFDENRKWTSVIVIPLVARDVPFGAMICCLHGERRQFEPADVALLENLGGRAATALDNAQLFQTIRDGERRKDEFLAMLGHELRNPLAAITNAGELTKLLDASDPTFAEALEVIRQQASLMKRLVDDLLDVSRITSGRVQLQRSQVSVGEILAQVAESNGPSFVARGHTLHLEAPKNDAYLLADPFRLEQILTNLLVNAAKYTDQGGKVWFGAQLIDGEVVFYVRDTGIGIGPDLLPNVFDLFSQANRSLHRAEGGLGIGLTIVRGLTELHGGRVWAESEGYGKGARFYVGLPAMTQAVAPKTVAPIVELGRKDKMRRILVVEDQPALSRVTVALLQKLGHEVRAAADGREALLAVRDYHPDVVLLDIGLPGMDGYEVARCLRTELGNETPKLIAMTGYSQQEVRRHARESDFDHHLVKPADIGVLRELLTSS